MPNATRQRINQRGQVQLNEGIGQPRVAATVNSSAMGSTRAPVNIDDSSRFAGAGWRNLSSVLSNLAVDIRRQEAKAERDAEKAQAKAEREAEKAERRAEMEEIRGMQLGLIRDRREILSGIRDGSISEDDFLSRVESLYALGDGRSDRIQTFLFNSSTSLLNDGLAALDSRTAVDTARLTEDSFVDDLDKIAGSVMDSSYDDFSSAVTSMQASLKEKGWNEQKFQQAALSTLQDRASILAGTEEGDALFDRIEAAYKNGVLTPSTQDGLKALTAFLYRDYAVAAENNASLKNSFGKQNEAEYQKTTRDGIWQRFNAAQSPQEKQAVIDDLRKEADDAAGILGAEQYAKLINELGGAVNAEINQQDYYSEKTSEAEAKRLIAAHRSGEISLSQSAIYDNNLLTGRGKTAVQEYLNGYEGVKNEIIQPYLTAALEQYQANIDKRGFLLNPADPAVQRRIFSAIKQTIADGYENVNPDDSDAIIRRDARLADLAEKATIEALNGEYVKGWEPPQRQHFTTDALTEKEFVSKIVKPPEAGSGTTPVIDAKALMEVPTPMQARVREQVQKEATRMIIDQQIKEAEERELLKAAERARSEPRSPINLFDFEEQVYRFSDMPQDEPATDIEQRIREIDQELEQTKSSEKRAALRLERQNLKRRIR